MATDRDVLGVPVVTDVRPHDSHGTACRLDSVFDAHIHVEADYGDGTLDLVAYGPYRRDSEVVDAWDRHDRWTRRSVPVEPSWWDRIRGQTLDVQLRHMAGRLIAEAIRYRRNVTAIDEMKRVLREWGER